MGVEECGEWLDEGFGEVVGGLELGWVFGRGYEGNRWEGV